MFANEGYSLSDVAAVTGGNKCQNYDAWGNNGSWWIIILFLFIFAGGWGNRGFGMNGATTPSGITDGYILTSDFANIERKIDSVNNGLCDGFYTTAQLVNGINGNINTSSQAILTQMNNNAVNAMQDTFALQTSMNNNTNALTAQGTALSNQIAQCCCDNRYEMATNFANLGYNLAEQSCQTRQAIADATTAITAGNDANTRSILAAIQGMQTQAMQDKINSLTADNQALKFAASQQAQNTYLVNELKNPCPIPAYMVPNPNAVYNYGFGCGCGCN